MVGGKAAGVQNASGVFESCVTEVAVWLNVAGGSLGRGQLGPPSHRQEHFIEAESSVFVNR